MVSLEAGALASVLAGAALCAGTAGWMIRRTQERSLRRAHEAAMREQIKAAGCARDRAREEAQEVEERLQRIKEEHRLDAERITALDAAVAAERADLGALRREVAASRKAHAGCGEREEQLERRIAELQSRLEVTERQREEAAPGWLLTAPQGRKDDLKAIRGVGPILERGLNQLGIFHFHQLARMTSRDIHWIAGRISAFPGLNKRYRWADQARGMVERPATRQGGNGGNGRHAATEKPRGDSI